MLKKAFILSTFAFIPLVACNGSTPVKEGITVTFDAGDGYFDDDINVKTKTFTIKDGETPSFNLKPKVVPDNHYAIPNCFRGWDHQFVPLHKDTTYHAQYYGNAVFIKYKYEADKGELKSGFYPDEPDDKSDSPTVLVDWGDGNYQSIYDIEENHKKFTHEYNVSKLTDGQEVTVRIYGDYIEGFTFRNPKYPSPDPLPNGHISHIEFFSIDRIESFNFYSVAVDNLVIHSISNKLISFGHSPFQYSNIQSIDISDTGYFIKPDSDGFGQDLDKLEHMYVRPGLFKQYIEDDQYSQLAEGIIEVKDDRDYAYVEFDAKDGYFGDDGDDHLRVIRVKKGEKPVFQLSPYCDGKTFKKWDSTFKVVVGDATYSAIYE